MNEDLNCMFCIHSKICKHWDKWSDHFPYKSDDLIKGHLKGISIAHANACAYYDKEKTNE